MQRIKEKGITAYDIIGGQSIDPEPDSHKAFGERVRCNKFRTDSIDLRLCELLTPIDKFDHNRPYDNIEIPLKDLVRYWWNNLIDQEELLYEVCDDILGHYKDRLLPPKKPEPEPDYSDAFDKVR